MFQNQQSQLSPRHGVLGKQCIPSILTGYSKSRARHPTNSFPIEQISIGNQLFTGQITLLTDNSEHE